MSDLKIDGAPELVSNHQLYSAATASGSIVRSTGVPNRAGFESTTLKQAATVSRKSTRKWFIHTRRKKKFACSARGKPRHATSIPKHQPARILRYHTDEILKNMAVAYLNAGEGGTAVTSPITLTAQWEYAWIWKETVVSY